MRKLIYLLTISFIGSVVVSGYAEARGVSHKKRGYIKRNGTYVAPSYATNPNRTKLDNWSTKGNLNPYTGKTGSKPAY